MANVTSLMMTTWNFTSELLADEFAVMTHIDHPKFVPHPRYVDEGLYLRFHVVKIPDTVHFDSSTYYAYHDTIIDWINENVKKRFSTRNLTTYLCFEDRKEAMMFKLAFC